MKEFIKGMIFWSIFLGIIFLMWGLAEFLASIVTIKMIVRMSIVALFIATFYILKETKEV